MADPLEKKRYRAPCSLSRMKSASMKRNKKKLEKKEPKKWKTRGAAERKQVIQSTKDLLLPFTALAASADKRLPIHGIPGRFPLFSPRDVIDAADGKFALTGLLSTTLLQPIASRVIFRVVSVSFSCSRRVHADVMANFQNGHN